MCQFLYFFYLTGTQKYLYSFELSNLLKEFLFAFAVTFLVSNLTFLFFEMPVTNLLMKTFNLNRRRDIMADEQKAAEQKAAEQKTAEQEAVRQTAAKQQAANQAVKYDYSEINNNNPDFKPIKPNKKTN